MHQAVLSRTANENSLPRGWVSAMDKMRDALFADATPATAPLTTESSSLDQPKLSLSLAGLSDAVSDEAEINRWIADIKKSLPAPIVEKKAGIFQRRKRSTTMSAAEVELLALENSQAALLQLLKMRDDARKQLEEAERNCAANQISYKELSTAGARFEGFRHAFDREKEKLRRQWTKGSSLLSPSVNTIRDGSKSPCSPALARRGDQFGTVLERVKEKIAEKERALQSLDQSDQEFYFVEASLAALQLNLVEMHKAEHRKQRAEISVEMPSLPLLVQVPDATTSEEERNTDETDDRDELHEAESESVASLKAIPSPLSVDSDLDNLLAGLEAL